MHHRDQSISEVTIILRSGFTTQLEAIIEQLTETGIAINSINEDIGSIVASCESNRILVLEHMEFVQAIRTNFSYIADYPAGDPRDVDGRDRSFESDFNSRDD